MPGPGRHLLVEDTLRGVADDELRAIVVPTLIVPSQEDPHHQHVTADPLGALIPDVVVSDREIPESPRPDFEEHLEDFINAVIPHL